MPSASMSAARYIPRSTTLSPSSGSITPSMAARTASTLRIIGHLLNTYRAGPVVLTGWIGCPCSRRSATTPATPSTSSWPDRRSRCRRPRSPRASICTRTRCGPTWSACARSGLLEVEVDSQGTVGRPQHRWSLAAEAPSLGLEPSAFRLLARLLAVAWRPWPASITELVAEVGRAEGRTAGSARAAARDPVLPARPWSTSWPTSGFDPAVGDDGADTTVAFTRCPFRELAGAFPDAGVPPAPGDRGGRGRGCPQQRGRRRRLRHPGRSRSLPS